jgi:hypothetical protein
MKEYLLRLHSIQRGEWGTVLDKAPQTEDYPAETLKGTLPDLAGLAQVHAGVGQCEDRVRNRLNFLQQKMARREKYPFIHNELGPDEHFLIREDGEITMLDIDGCHFADLEREHAYLRLRFAEFYPALTRPDLDPIRMDYYQLCLHIMAAYGHYLLLKQGYPGEEDIRQIYETNAQKVVTSTLHLTPVFYPFGCTKGVSVRP